MRKELKAIYQANLRDFGHLSDEEIMALTIYAEARGEILGGKLAVGTVILNRVKHRDWDGKNVRDVCLLAKQFSCYNPDDAQRPILVKLASDMAGNVELKDCMAIAIGLLKGNIRQDKDLVKNKCCQYLNPKTAPEARERWIRAGMKSIKIIGNHEFFKDS